METSDGHGKLGDGGFDDELVFGNLAFPGEFRGVVIPKHTLTMTAGYEEVPMVPTKKKKSSRSIQEQEPSIPGGNTLSLVAFGNGERGFMAKGEDSSALGFFDLDGEPIYFDPGFLTVIRNLGAYAPGDKDGFWALVARV